jgi:hypothetical protein
VQLQRVLEAALLQRFLEPRRIRHDHRVIQLHGLLAATHDGARAQCQPQVVQRLAQGRAATVRVEFRPEQAQQRVPPVRPARPRHGQVCQQCQPLRLHGHRLYGSAIGASQLHGPKKAKLNHCNHFRYS